MRLRSIPTIISLAWLALAGLAPLAAGQDLARERAQLALDVTDRRIEQAQVVVSGSDLDQAHAEVDLAVDIQGRAKSAFGVGQYLMAGRLTLDARGHADRAIALVRGLPDPDRVWAQLERTREMLDRARDRVEACADDRARALVRVASEMQDRAEGAAGAGRYLGALQMTMGARERVLRALHLCRMEENVQDSAGAALRHTETVISRAREQLGAGGSEAARAALSRAEDLESEAMKQFTAEHFDASLRLTLNARTFAHRAVRLAGGGL